MNETSEDREAAPVAGAGHLFEDDLREMPSHLHQIAESTAQEPLFDFGPEFAPLTRSLAMISEPQPLLGLMVGGPKLGKTNLLLNLALGLIENMPCVTVAFVSAEVPRRALRMRLLCAHLARRQRRGEENGEPVTLAALSPSGKRLHPEARERLAMSADLMRRAAGRLLTMHRDGLRSGAIHPGALHEALTRLRAERPAGEPLVIMLDYDAYLEVDPRSEGVARDELRIKTLGALANEHRALLITPHQARKGQGGWNGGGFEATKGSGEFVYAADFVMHLRGRARQATSEDGGVLIRADLMNRHGSGDGFFLEAHHAQAMIRAHPDQREAERRWEGAEPKKQRDPAEVARVIQRIERAHVAAEGNLMGTVRKLGLPAVEANRKAVRIALQQRHVSVPLHDQLAAINEQSTQPSLPL